MTYSDFLANTSTYVADTSFLINLNATSFSLEIIDKMKPSTIIRTQQVYDELRNGTKDGYNDFKNVEDYRFFEATLTHAQSTWGRRMYFIVNVEGRELETRAIFHAYGLLGPQFNEYSNATALIGYNNKTEEVVITERK